MLSISTIDEKKINIYWVQATLYVSNIESLHNSMSMWLSLFYG